MHLGFHNTLMYEVDMNLAVVVSRYMNPIQTSRR
jgi:hypothetical protein